MDKKDNISNADGIEKSPSHWSLAPFKSDLNSIQIQIVVILDIITS